MGTAPDSGYGSACPTLSPRARLGIALHKMFKDISKSIHHFAWRCGILIIVRCNDNSSLSLFLNRLAAARRFPTAGRCIPCPLPPYGNAETCPTTILKNLCFPSCFFCVSMVIYWRSEKLINFRVWRSLVSRLTGGQEAAGSSPVTRTIFSIKTADFQRFLSFSRTFYRFLFFAVVARPRFDPYQRNFRERRFFLPTLPVSIATLLLFFFQMAWAMNPPIRSAASLRISPVTWA